MFCRTIKRMDEAPSYVNQELMWVQFFFFFFLLCSSGSCIQMQMSRDSGKTRMVDSDPRDAIRMIYGVTPFDSSSSTSAFAVPI